MILVGENLDEAPPLQFAQGTSFHDADTLPFLGLALFIMRIELGRALDDLFELRVRHAAYDFDHDGLVHFGGHDLTDASLAQAALDGGGGGFSGGGDRIAHDEN